MKVNLTIIRRKRGLFLRLDDKYESVTLEVRKLNDCEVYTRGKELYFSLPHFEELNRCTIVSVQDISN